MLKMSYNSPPSEWIEGLPIGNGRLAAMVWGCVGADALALNHEWLWRGNNRGRKVAPAADKLEDVRSLLRERDYFRAGLVANVYYAGGGGLSRSECRVDPYQPAGSLEFSIDEELVFESRELDIEIGVASAERRTAAGVIRSEFFASCESGLILSSWTSKSPFSGILRHTRPADPNAVHDFKALPGKLVFDCEFIGGISHRVATEIQTDGETNLKDNAIEVKGATYLRCTTNIATSVLGIESEIAGHKLEFAEFETEKERHTARFSRSMNAVELQIEDDESLDSLSVTERLGRIKTGKRDNGLTALYFDMGRYLMMSSSICASLPANLQGKWNDRIDPAWESDYHLDINLEMNYWMAEPCNMPECAEALIKFVESFFASGREAAEKLYGCRGIWLPIQTDAWGASTPESFGWACWVGAAPWLAQNFWNRYIYSGDIEYLRTRGYRYFKAVAEFFEDYLVEDESGILQVMPSQSPENTFQEASGHINLPVGICSSSAMDVQLIYDALTYAIDAAKLLEIDAEPSAKWESMRSRLPGFGIGSDGRLLEWGEEVTEREDEMGHRHLSHLYGVFPSSLFTSENRAEQYEAARKSLEFRISHGGGYVGWSRAWIACLQARFGNADGFHENLTALIRDFSTFTLLDSHIECHPPKILLVDGNLGAVQAVIEAVISYTDGKVHLLRSLPNEWKSGSLKGIKVPGGHLVDVCWRNGKAASLKVVMGFAGSVAIRVNGEDKLFSGHENEVFDVFLE
jgi:alpha-L-fucosidase 2